MLKPSQGAHRSRVVREDDLDTKEVFIGLSDVTRDLSIEDEVDSRETNTIHAEGLDLCGFLWCRTSPTTKTCTRLQRRQHDRGHCIDRGGSRLRPRGPTMKIVR
jgi:hypothetical protein